MRQDVKAIAIALNNALMSREYYGELIVKIENGRIVYNHLTESKRINIKMVDVSIFDQST